MFVKAYVSASVRLTLALIMVAGIFDLVPAQASGAIRYVKWNANGTNNGTAWTNAYTDLQSALSAAVSGDEIWVAAGTYKPTTGTNSTVSFILKNGVAIYGGFAGLETLRSQRNPAGNVTILSGDIGIAGNISDNSHHVVSGGGANRSAVLDGFTVTSGNADDVTTFTSGSGGGMLNDMSSPTVANVIFYENTAFFNGGGMYNVNYSSPSLTNVTFRANRTGGGGGMSNYFGNPVLRNVLFIENFAFSSGGGMEDYRSSPVLTDVAFINNVSDYHGGGIYTVGEGSSPILTNVTFSGNQATTAGGGMSASVDTRPILTNVTFHGNTSFVGGAMYLFFTTPTLTNVTISSNTATHVGGLYNEGSTLTVRNSILWGNTPDEQIANRGSTFVSYSIIEGGFTGIGNLMADPLLGGLANNGGFTKTMALAVNSPAINAGENPTCPATDQRGITRPQGARCDMGAYEQAYMTITGNVGVAGAALEYIDGTVQTILSSPNGNYAVGVPTGWSGTVTPSHSCFTFTPASQNYSSVTVNQTGQNFTSTFDSGSGCANISALIGGTDQGGFGLLPGESTRASFTGVNSGPVEIMSHNNVPLIGAERLIYKFGGVNTSFTEMMGLPSSQLDTTYWLPWYNNVDLDTQLRFANVSGSPATVTITIGTQQMGDPIQLAAGASTRVSFAGVNNGPVKIVSTQNIVAAERLIYKVNGKNTSFSEMMALPASQLDSTYWLPWYNNVDLDTQLRFANVSNAPAQVRVYIGGAEMQGSPFTLLAGESTRKSFPGINNGPVEIVSDQNIVAAERLIYKVNNINTSFTEMMALPNSKLDMTYWLPWYNNVDLDTQLRFANVHDTQTAQVHVYIGGAEMPDSPFTLLPGASTRQSFAGINNGPVKIVSNVPIVAAERLIYKVNGVNTSFSEMMALPNSLLDTTYWLPWYNNVDLDTQLRFGIP